MSMKKAPVESFVNFKRAVVVEKFGLKPDWNGERILELIYSLYNDNWLKISFSKNFVIEQIIEIGR